MKNKNYITTGEMARMMNINKKTLIYYDEIGLFSPTVKADNGYRYYTFRQVLPLYTIVTLRRAGISIQKIKILIMQVQIPKK